MAEPSMRLNRRGLLRAGAGLAAAAGLGAAAGPGAAVAGPIAGATGPIAGAADVPASKRFDLKAPSHDLFRHKPLRDDTVQQSFTFDNVNRRLFVVQRRNGTGSAAGDLCVTRLDFAGNQLGYMYLTGFGHGVSIAAEPVGSASYLWTEVDANANGYGRRLARFEFRDGATLPNSSTALAKFTPVADATEHTCAVDPVHGRLVVRYHRGGAKRFAVYELARASAGDFGTRLADFAQPALGSPAPVFQGYTAHGRYLYLLDGESYDSSPTLNSRVTSVDINTGEIAEGPVITRAGESLTYREPEGMAVYRTEAGETRLFLGFASGAAGDRRCNLFYKNVLV
ncbi:teichoic acid biosynthesis protein C [Saccharopolyspora erythraea]|uniref:phage baseplate protein n=1 Tax=Saccharopolyspora erythraea TaxID=1836 RepID=UPI001BA896C4|nr:teichoic acid biosynthesis protein C [Saccharopolyspora erythraea]QUH02418.1 teichoic acid biosynthesis protein C [Saccharopolyspora erythraea]